MVSNTKNVPRLRFKGFSGEWVNKPFGTIAEIRKGKFDPVKNKSSVKCIELEHLSQNTGEILGYIKSESVQSIKNVFNNGDVLFGKLRPNLRKYALASFDGICSSEIWGLYSNIVSNDFLFHLIQTDKFYEQSTVSSGTKMPRADWKLIASGEFHIPVDIKEQQKIADFLSTVDKKIQQLKQKQQLLQQYKKGMMQKLFSQQIRFKDENGLDYPEWDERELGDILYYEQPTKYIVNNTDYDDSYDIPVLTAGKSFILGYTSEKEGIFNSNLPVIIFDDFTTDNKYVNFPFKVKSSAMKILYNDKFHSNIKFIYESINMINFSKGDEHKRYWISEYQYISIGFPSLPEQQKIADFLSSIDKKIDAVNQQISQMAQFKQGLLQQLFV